MITYKNISFSAKTFYGVKFNPGEIREVPGYINHPSMVRVFGKQPKQRVESPSPIAIFEESTKVETRGRKKKSSEPEKDLFAETETTIENSKEETSNGNPS